MSRSNLQIVLPYPPSINNYYFHRAIPARGKKKGFVQKGVAADGLQFQRRVADLVDRYLPWVQCCGESRFSVHIRMEPPTLRRCDVDNIQKPILDALTLAGIWADDEQVDELRTSRGPICRPAGRVVVRIRNLGIRSKPAPDLDREDALRIAVAAAIPPGRSNLSDEEVGTLKEAIGRAWDEITHGSPALF